ncbi:amidohydrolase [Aquisediminimonas profunda]|uniref:amidohydrolase n=1 Tax=Aquisediminimonas profunda TaxID=1550733 RepID=UPI001C62DE4A|nr:amidohydrolase [Aquisediminimonas profunda]
MKRLALLFGLAATMANAAPSAPMATVWQGGPIITMAGEQPELVEAIAVRDGRIIAVGSLKTVQAAAGRRAAKVDLKGRTLLPGFIDAHGHVSSVGQAAGLARLAPPPVGKVDSIAALQDVLRADSPPPGMPIIVGNGYDDSQLAERRHPTRHDLDAVFADKPVLIVHASGHFAVFNSAMLKLAGIGPDTPDPQGGVIRREADGKTPDGVLEETAFFNVAAKIIPPSLDNGVMSLVAGEKIYAANGITTAQDGRVMPEAWPALAEAARRGVLPIDTVALISFEREWPADVRALIGKSYDHRVRIGGIKLTIDGSPQGRTAWLHDPVPVPPPGKDAGYRGYAAIDLGLFNAKLAEAAVNGWQVFVHVNGDEAMQALIDGVAKNGLTGKRTIAIHSQVVRREQLDDMKKLDIQPSFFASHTWYWGDWHRDVALGPMRADFISPQASAWAVGLRPTAHNDSPVVPPDMMRLIWSSVNRRTQSGDILGPMERISPYRALQQVTINAAWQIHEDGDKGSLAAGKRADLVVLDANPLASDPTRLFEIKVVATIKDGRTIFGAID